MRLIGCLALGSLALLGGSGCGSSTSASPQLTLSSLTYDTVAGPCPPATSCHWKLTIDGGGAAIFDDAGTARQGVIPSDLFAQFRAFIGRSDVVDALRNTVCPAGGAGLDTQSSLEVAFSNGLTLTRMPVEACQGPPFDDLSSWMGRFEQGLRGGAF